eukprot:785672-Prorocentrum_minimum.AAC.2
MGPTRGPVKRSHIIKAIGCVPKIDPPTQACSLCDCFLIRRVRPQGGVTLSLVSLVSGGHAPLPPPPIGLHAPPTRPSRPPPDPLQTPSRRMGTRAPRLPFT